MTTGIEINRIRRDSVHSAPAVLPAIKNLTRSTAYAITAALAFSFSPAKSNASESSNHLKSGKSDDSLIVANPKKELGSHYKDLKKSIKANPKNSEQLIKNYITKAFDGGTSSLANQLKEQDPKVYKSMINALNDLVKNQPKLKTNLALRLSPSKQNKDNIHISTKDSPSQLVVSAGNFANVVSLKEQAVKVDYSKLPHCKQPYGTKWCGMASAVTMAQLKHGYDLTDPKVLSLLAGTASRKCRIKKMYSAGTIGQNFSKLGLYNRFVDPGMGIKFKNTNEVKAFAKKILEKDIINILKSGKKLGLSCGRMNGAEHAIGLLDYNPETKQFLIVDSLYEKPISKPIEYLMKEWPEASRSSRRKGEYKFHYFVVESNLKTLPSTSKVPSSASIMVPEKCLDLLSQKIELTPDTLYPYQVGKTLPDFGWQLLSECWEKDIKADELKGLPIFAKINIASTANGTQNNLPVVLYQDQKDKEIRMMFVSGYRGGFLDFDSEVRVVTKSGSEWISCLEYNKRVASIKTKKGTTNAWIGYIDMKKLESQADDVKVDNIDTK